MLERVTVETPPLANRYARHVPMAVTYCNACRTCVQTNALAAVAAAGIFVVPPSRRLFGRS